MRGELLKIRRECAVLKQELEMVREEKGERAGEGMMMVFRSHLCLRKRENL